jgi:hypothetical protein
MEQSAIRGGETQFGRRIGPSGFCRMPLTTPQSLINLTLRAIGVLGVGQSALPEDYSDCFDLLNGMLARWNRKRWLVWHLTDNAFVSTGALSYSVGPGGNFPVSIRPDRLEAAFFRQFVSSQPNKVDYPLQILESREDYNRIALKNLSSWPQFIFYDSAYSANDTPPNCGFVYPWPVPQASIYELHLTLKETLPQFTSYTQTVNLPPEYISATWSNLALEAAAIYPGSSVSQATIDVAKASLAAIRGANAQIPMLSMPAGLVRPALYNIYSDQTY